MNLTIIQLHQTKTNLTQAIKCYQAAELQKDVELIYNPKTKTFTCENK